MEKKFSFQFFSSSTEFTKELVKISGFFGSKEEIVRLDFITEKVSCTEVRDKSEAASLNPSLDFIGSN